MAFLPPQPRPQAFGDGWRAGRRGVLYQRDKYIRIAAGRGAFARTVQRVISVTHWPIAQKTSDVTFKNS